MSTYYVPSTVLGTSDPTTNTVVMSVNSQKLGLGGHGRKKPQIKLLNIVRSNMKETNKITIVLNKNMTFLK